jgi:hypothetical protein
MSAVFFQDSIGLITFDARSNQLGAVRPRIGKGQVIHCLEAYDEGRGLQDLKVAGSLSATLIGFSRKTSLVPVVSDFLFEDPAAVIRELSLANNVHDVFVVLVDAAYAFELPALSAGWVQARVQAWQDDVAAMAGSRTWTSCGWARIRPSSTSRCSNGCRSGGFAESERVRSAGVRSAEAVRGAGCGGLSAVRGAECGVRSAGCGGDLCCVN